MHKEYKVCSNTICMYIAFVEKNTQQCLLDEVI